MRVAVTASEVSLSTTMQQAISEGFDFVAMGRALLREPNLLRRIRADTSTGSACVHCDESMPTIYTRTRCDFRPEQQAEPL
ncbi:hypothetical protein [Nocardia cyriacigeorgica]|uniref:hypothetical protein n=1 Tax=Nocardia cyriacigeorgica TaxID=135487 RepID=UPI00031D1879|nr:hypothetical protein [Nocardia cyriacigeorgica]MBF6499141.1 hypothetical protein [Nocardia cyriacigeorgica]